ncbi:unnamed protein product, partial [marine sediment metagenome]
EEEKFVPWVNEYGTDYVENHRNALGLIKDIKSAATDEQWQATFGILPDDGVKTRVTMLGQKGTEVLTAQMPSVRRAKEKNDRIYDYYMPLVIARRKGKKLKSRFLAVHEPYREKPFIESLRLKKNVLIVRSENFTDYHFFNNASLKEKAAKLKGLYGFIRIRHAYYIGIKYISSDGELLSAYLADGTLLKFRDRKFTLPKAEKGTVSRTEGAALFAKGRCSSENADRIYLAFPNNAVYAPQIKEIARGGKNSSILLKSHPGFEFDSDGKKG